MKDELDILAESVIDRRGFFYHGDEMPPEKFVRVIGSGTYDNQSSMYGKGLYCTRHPMDALRNSYGPYVYKLYVRGLDTFLHLDETAYNSAFGLKDSSFPVKDRDDSSHFYRQDTYRKRDWDMEALDLGYDNRLKDANPSYGASHGSDYEKFVMDQLRRLVPDGMKEADINSLHSILRNYAEKPTVDYSSNVLEELWGILEKYGINGVTYTGRQDRRCCLVYDLSNVFPVAVATKSDNPDEMQSLQFHPLDQGKWKSSILKYNFSLNMGKRPDLSADEVIQRAIHRFDREPRRNSQQVIEMLKLADSKDYNIYTRERFTRILSIPAQDTMSDKSPTRAFDAVVRGAFREGDRKGWGAEHVMGAISSFESMGVVLPKNFTMDHDIYYLLDDAKQSVWPFAQTLRGILEYFSFWLSGIVKDPSEGWQVRAARNTFNSLEEAKYLAGETMNVIKRVMDRERFEAEKLLKGDGKSFIVGSYVLALENKCMEYVNIAALRFEKILQKAEDWIPEMEGMEGETQEVQRGGGAPAVEPTPATTQMESFSRFVEGPVPGGRAPRKLGAF